MNIPNKIKILSHEYSVKIDTKLELREGRLGFMCGNTLEIGIDDNVPESQIAETVLHEIFEAIRYHLNLGDTFGHQVLSQVSEALLSVIRDNDLDFRKEEGTYAKRNIDKF